MAEITGFGIAIICFLIASLVIGTLTYKLVKKSGRRLMVAGKTLPLFFVGTMLAAQSIDGNSSLGNAALVYQFGFWAGAVIPIGLGICLLLTGFFYGKPLNKMTMFTLPDFYFRRFGNAAEGISGVLMIISFTVLVAGNFAASGFILQTVFGIDFIWGVLIAALVVLAYTFAGGLFSSAYTDIFQIYLAIGAFWAAFIFFAGGFAGVPFDTILGSAPPGYMDLSGLTDIASGALINWAGILALGLGDIVALDFMERVFAAKDAKTAQPDLAINHMPFAIGASLLMGVLGAAMSTANGGLLAISSVVSRNLIQRIIRRRWLHKEPWTDKKLLWVTRVVIIPMMVAGFILAWQVPQPGIYLILAFDIVFAGAFAPLTLGLFWRKSNMPAAIAALLVGSVLRLIFFFTMPIEWAGLDTMIPPPVSFAVFIGVALATQKKWPGKARHDVRDYVPPEEDLISGEDLKHFVPSSGEDASSKSAAH